MLQQSVRAALAPLAPGFVPVRLYGGPTSQDIPRSRLRRLRPLPNADGRHGHIEFRDVAFTYRPLTKIRCAHFGLRAGRICDCGLIFVRMTHVSPASKVTIPATPFSRMPPYYFHKVWFP